ncbi:FRG domain-containing protein [Burkholderia cenocepacia]|uniref:FRG domain-containing protein n=1 Tax=Burkholderia cenocepacia TaxID=95486 RepID=UPI001AA194B0|nr:FRG domain-containing protein [Burkholderia cenocepacia]MBO1855018.1 FRG domain-containing protein [Burkholderia cenocepacia]MDR5642667.1 FRG domain-containing protein [Burkholderia cenocepacia]
MQTAPASALLEMSKDYVDHLSRREASWYWHSDGDTRGAIPFAVSTLYRGQNARFTPMLPSIARGLQSRDIEKIFESPVSDQAKIVLRIAQAWWFARELARHPISSHAASQHLDLNEIALAQHYGIPTGYLDLSDDFNVSAFFATCYETEKGWRPVDTGVGIVYRVHLGILKNPFNNYIPLGPQQLPRPSEQCAWVTELPFCHSFEGSPGVEMLQFQHDRNVGEYFLEMYNGGERLFPRDPLADVAAEILACREIPIDLMDAALDSLATDPYGVLPAHLPALRNEISALTSLVSYRRLLTDRDIESLITNQDWSRKMLGVARARAVAVRRIRVPQAGTDTESDLAS